MDDTLLKLIELALNMYNAMPEEIEALPSLYVVAAIAVALPLSLKALDMAFFSKANRSSYRKIASCIPSLSPRERAALLIAYESSDVWARGDIAGPVSSLFANGYLTRTYTGGCRGDCFVMPTELRSEIANNSEYLKSLTEASEIAQRWLT